MSNLNTLRALEARLAAATGADRELSTDINRALLVQSSARHRGPHVTASIDAAVELIERALPGWGWSVRCFMAAGSRSGIYEAVVWHREPAEGFTATDSSAALALCRAIIRALIIAEIERLDRAAMGDDA